MSKLNPDHADSAGAAASDPSERVVPTVTQLVSPLALGAGCPTHASWQGADCACDPGFIAGGDGRGCEPGVACPPFASPLDDDWCLCDPGYQPDLESSGCAPLPAPEPSCPEHASAVDGGCVCDTGYDVDADGASCAREPVMGRVCIADADCSELVGGLCLRGSAGQGVCSRSCYGQSGVCGTAWTCACSDAGCTGALCFPICQADVDCAAGFHCSTYLLADGNRAGLCDLG